MDYKLLLLQTVIITVNLFIAFDNKRKINNSRVAGGYNIEIEVVIAKLTLKSRSVMFVPIKSVDNNVMMSRSENLIVFQ